MPGLRMHMEKHQVTVDHNLCIGCYCCSTRCSNFEIRRVADAFKSHPLKEIVDDDIEAHKEAEAGCPVNCIKVTKLGG